MRHQFAEYLGAVVGASDRAELALSAGRGCAPTWPARERPAKRSETFHNKRFDVNFFYVLQNFRYLNRHSRATVLFFLLLPVYSKTI